VKPRIDYMKKTPGVREAMLNLEHYVAKSGLDPALTRLVKLRASQINGCSFCVDLHFGEALAAKEDIKKLYFTSARHEAPVFNAKEQAALAWTEAVTRLGDGGVSDAVYAQAQSHFSEEELSNLTLAIVAINGWNRLNVAFRFPPPTKTEPRSP
jgi:AhpD family alkylhydroperoxidase